MNNYISVDEFIKLKDISYDIFISDYNSGVYDFYSIKKNNEIYISVSLIDDYIPIPKEENITHQNNNTPDIIHNNNDDIDTLKKEIERLHSIIAEKDKIITDKDNKIIEFAEKFADLTQQAFQITSQGQYIQALDKAPETANNEILPQTIEIIPPKKQNIFNRLFKKNKVVK